ncbi:PRC-barrel domain-containing protein [Actinoplanes sp. CA-142083]|uniref:PRC-barrel domain-containing protein n=1 Tax=Actinoplanes sp. CA-142083 TaxID=3239903 RepID=UPI003D94AE7E
MLIGFDLLDRQIVDRDGEPVGKVDDVELTYDENGVPRVTGLLLGQQALGERIGGGLGRWISAIARRMSEPPDQPPIRIAYDLVAKVDSAVHLSVARELLPEPPLETWVRDHLIGSIPGARHD